MKKQITEQENHCFFTEKNGTFQLNSKEIITIIHSYNGVSLMKLITGKTKCIAITKGKVINVMEDENAIAYIKSILLRREEVTSLNNPDLIDKIKTARFISKTFIRMLPANKYINFYDKDLHKDEYLYYRNCAVRINEESVACVNYEDLPFYIFAEQILPYDFTLMENYPLKMLLPSKERRISTFTASGKESDSKYIKFLRDISNISWRKKRITLEEHRVNEFAFFNKVMFLGSMLSHFRKEGQNKIHLVGSLNIAMGINNEYYAIGKSLLCKFLNYGAVGTTLDCKPNVVLKSAIKTHVLPSFFIFDNMRSTDKIAMLSADINSYKFDVSLGNSIKESELPNVVAITNNLNHNMCDSLKRRVFEVPISDYYHTTENNNARYPYCGIDLFETPVEKVKDDSTFEAMAHKLQREELQKSLKNGSVEDQLQKQETLKELLQKEKQARDEQLKASDNSEALNDLFNLLARCVQIYMQYAKDKDLK